MAASEPGLCIVAGCREPQFSTGKLTFRWCEHHRLEHMEAKRQARQQEEPPQPSPRLYVVDWNENVIRVFEAMPCASLDMPETEGEFKRLQKQWRKQGAQICEVVYDHR